MLAYRVICSVIPPVVKRCDLHFPINKRGASGSKVKAYSLVSQARFSLVISTQLILACSVSPTSYLSTIDFIYVELTSYTETIVLCMQK